MGIPWAQKTDAQRAEANAYRAAWRLVNGEREKAMRTAARHANPEKHREQCAAWRRANPDRSNAISAKWRASHPEQAKASDVKMKAKAKTERPDVVREQIRAASARKYAKRPEAQKAANAKWYRANKDRVIASSNRRRVHAQKNGGKYTAADVRDCLTLQDGRCFYCVKPLTDYHVDHMTPLCRGGSNGPENIVVTCPRCNLSKHTKTAAEFILNAA